MIIIADQDRLAMTPQEVQERLKLNQLKDKIWYVVPSCATTGEGLFEGLVSSSTLAVQLLLTVGLGLAVKQRQDAASTTTQIGNHPTGLTNFLFCSSVQRYQCTTRTISWGKFSGTLSSAFLLFSFVVYSRYPCFILIPATSHVAASHTITL